MNIPLAERIRPQSFEEYISQNHLVGDSGILTRSLAANSIPSIILWGPPGTGKTTLAEIIAKESQRSFFSLSAINSGVKDIREIIEKAKNSNGMFTTKSPILFIDEIHRFSKSQQDSLLAAVERGWITLIGATTENPSFEIIPALLSRCQVYTLSAFTKEDLLLLLHRAMEKDSFLKSKKIFLKETQALFRVSGGDGRKLLNTFELVVHALSEAPTIEITNENVMHIVQNHLALYDKNGEQHYDIISAFIKSIRGSDPNAAIYWLARMIEGGEDVKFIARRLLIAASEDIGLANPTAVIMANNIFQAVSVIGNPESRILLSQCTIYLATSPKSNSSYMAIDNALECVKQTGNLPVPLALRNAPTKLMKELGYGQEYKYSHDFANNFAYQEFMPEEISGFTFYKPSENSREQQTKDFLSKRWGGKYTL